MAPKRTAKLCERLKRNVLILVFDPCQGRAADAEPARHLGLGQSGLTS
jgi:hypothetical protein